MSSTNSTRVVSIGRQLKLILLVAVLFGTLFGHSASAQVDSDPLQTVNRGVHVFNGLLDKVALKPLSRVYDTVTPRFVKRAVRNVFKNVDDVQVTFNDILQLRFDEAASNFSRLAINSTIGVGGLFDVASEVGLTKSDQDFGKTLAHWGVGPGAYVVLPIFGPSTLRDAVGLGVDSLVNPIPMIDDVPTRNTVLAVNAADTRSALLGFEGLVVGDSYLFFRDAYLQQREYQLNEGVMSIAFDEF